MGTMLIGQVARLAGVPITTIRFYERKGLIGAPQRRESGYRLYDEGTIDQIRFIRNAQELGFTLEEIAELDLLRKEASTTCREMKLRTEAKLETVREKIRQLHALESVLQRITDECEGEGPLSNCPILDTLQDRAMNQQVER